jgi:stage II sporulation protein D
MRAGIAAVSAAMALALLAGPSSAAGWAIRGHGFGHGIGMSQYGAYGFAKHGRNYRQILGHYYVHTRIGKVNKKKSIKVLLTSGVGSISFSGARKACGRGTAPGKSYRFSTSGSGVALQNSVGKTLRQCGGTGVAKSKNAISVPGQGTYRGELLANNQSGSLYIVNRVGIEGYVEGVIPNEMPASWAQQALRAQAVAARSYGLANARGGAFDVYDDTRSQVYGGKGTEQHASNAATKHTAREVVKAGKTIATTYFFSTSGGHTESVENSFVGSDPVRYLKGVKDPYDNISPVHRWKVNLTWGQVGSRLSGLYSGHLRRIKVLQRGTSPRIVYAKVLGSSGGTKVTGATLRDRLGLLDTWMSFGKHESGVPAGGGGGGHHHHGGGSGGGGGGIGPGKLRALVETGPVVQPAQADIRRLRAEASR